MKFAAHTLIAVVAFGLIISTDHAGARSAQPNCKKIDAALHINVKGDDPIHAVESQSNCQARTSNGHPIPDPKCTPGAVNPSLTLKALRSASFTTKCVRNKNTTDDAKNATYDWYGIDKPANNTGKNQTCEKDHLVSLELGGADSLDNIWPQCGPNGVPLNKRYFKIKDDVENYLAAQVKAGKIRFREAQEGIAKDWTLYLHDAQDYWKTHRKLHGGGD